MNADAKGIILGVDEINVGHGTGNVIENNIVSSNPDFAAQIAFKKAVINVGGSGSGIRTAVGLVTHYIDENNQLQASNVTINVNSTGVGYDFRNTNLSDPILTSNAVVGDAYTINVADQATGLRTNTRGNVISYATVTMKNNATGTA